MSASKQPNTEMDYCERTEGYYEQRAAEYDDAYLGEGLYADQGQDHLELWALERAISALPPAKVLDVGCGTAFLTRPLEARWSAWIRGRPC